MTCMWNLIFKMIQMNYLQNRYRLTGIKTKHDYQKGTIRRVWGGINQGFGINIHTLYM